MQQEIPSSFGKKSLLFVLVISLLSVSGCLGLKSSKRQPNNDAKDCAGVSCWKPPSNKCTADDALLVYAPSGYCSGGECSYATRQEQCHSGVCNQGECVNTPCQGKFCIDPPEPFCTDTNRTIWAPSGYCSGGKCSYASKTSVCDFLCKSGTCTDSPCTEVYCRKPPAPYCQDDKNLVVFEQAGRCTVVENRPKCLHDSQTIACKHGCKDGRCQGDPCVGVVCDRPPARYCDGAELVIFEPYGFCTDHGFCAYIEQRKPCIDPCVDAHCGEDPPCTSDCNEPPASYCLDGSKLRVYARDGWCEDGFCFYTTSDIDCPDGCKAGRCKDKPCIGKVCDKPPASYCDGNTLVDFNPEGTCDDGNGNCFYQKEPTSCQNDCEDAECLTGGDTDTDTNTNSELSWISITGGTFNMGSTDGDADEQPVHSVTVQNFEMLETEVTVTQYAACVTAGSCTVPSTEETECNWNETGYEEHPVNCVDWNQAVTFCEWAGGRLPSEAEWEYAASNGSSGNTYPWGDELATCSYAVMYEGGNGCGMDSTWEVCSKTDGNTGHGLCDMAGNVCEWVQDWYHSDYTGAPTDGSAWEDPVNSYRVFRGGGFGGSTGLLRAAQRRRYDFSPSRQYGVFVGFRCAR